MTVGSTTYNGNHITNAARSDSDGTSGDKVSGGLCDTTGSGAWSGKVVLCQRGTIGFVDKVNNVQSGGGFAAVIYNNVPGGFFGTLGDGVTSSIPAISLSQEDGQAALAQTVVASTVVSKVEQPANGYAYFDGTSMATPHVSAVAALVWSYNTSWTNVQIRNALTATARDKGTVGRDTSYGFGIVQAKAALDYLQPPPPATPAAPSGLTATAASSSQINLSWTDASTNESGFKIEQSTDGTNFAQVATTSANATTYPATALSASTMYYYRVRAYNATGDSAYSNTANATTQAAPPPPSAPDAPSGLAASTTRNSVTLTWTDKSSNEDGFRVYRCTGSTCTPVTLVGSVSSNTTTFTNSGLSRRTTYRYQVLAYNGGGDSAASNIASGTTK